MMGLPPGWVTDSGIPRSAQLKALGNGIVPQQMALALRLLLDMDAVAVPAATQGPELPTPVAAASKPAAWKPGVQWWQQSRAARNLEAIVTGRTPHMEPPS